MEDNFNPYLHSKANIVSDIFFNMTLTEYSIYFRKLLRLRNKKLFFTFVAFNGIYSVAIGHYHFITSILGNDINLNVWSIILKTNRSKIMCSMTTKNNNFFSRLKKSYCFAKPLGRCAQLFFWQRCLRNSSTSSLHGSCLGLVYNF